jgi:hypothetical protein
MIKDFLKKHQVIPSEGTLLFAVYLKTKPEIYLGHFDGKGLYIYNYEDKSIKNLKKDFMKISALTATSDDKYVLASTDEKFIRFICTEKQTIVKTMNTSQNSIQGIQVSRDCKWFYLVGDSKLLSKFSIQDLKLESQYKFLSPSQKHCLVLGNKSNLIYGSAYNNDAAVAINLRKHKADLLNSVNSIRCHGLDILERFLISSETSESIFISNLFQKKKVCSVSYKHGTITCMKATRNKIFLGCYNDSFIVIEDKFPFKKLYQVDYHSGVFGMDIGPSQDQIVVGGYGGPVTIYKILGN